MALAVPDLRDDRLVLRPPEHGDIDGITAMCQDADIARFTRVPSPYDRGHAVDWVEHATAAWNDGTSASFLITDAADSTLLGSIAVMRLDADRTISEIGYFVASDARNRGIATSAVRLTAQWAVRGLGVRRLELVTHVENTASQRVAAGAGFHREGVLRSYLTLGDAVADVVMFSLLRDDLS